MLTVNQDDENGTWKNETKIKKNGDLFKTRRAGYAVLHPLVPLRVANIVG
jgi:hypothetical protein